MTTQKIELRTDANGDIITIEAFEAAKAELMAAGYCDESYTYDQHCNIENDM